MIYGIILIVIMIFMPEGLTAGGVNQVRRLRRRLAERRRAQLQESVAS